LLRLTCSASSSLTIPCFFFYILYIKKFELKNFYPCLPLRCRSGSCTLISFKTCKVLNEIRSTAFKGIKYKKEGYCVEDQRQRNSKRSGLYIYIYKTIWRGIIAPLARRSSSWRSTRRRAKALRPAQAHFLFYKKLL
jgi:hypothetical protein